MAGLQIRVDSAEFRRVMQQARGFDRRLYLQLRRRMRAAARPMVEDVQRKIRSGGASKTGMRDALAAGTRATISTNGKRAGVTFTTSPSKLPADKRPMAKSWNKSTWRHPVHGNRETWVTQAGNPYFNTIVQRRFAMQQAVLAALQDAIKEMEGRR